jgi:outer membrane immunogenic protein
VGLGHVDRGGVQDLALQAVHPAKSGQENRRSSRAHCHEDIMKKLLISTAAFAALSTAAVAADLPRKTVAPTFAAVPAFSWTGFYVGLNAGYAWGKSDTSTTLGGNWAGETLQARTGVTALGSPSISPRGFTGGLQAGYNMQFNALVVGIEADVNYFGLKRRATSFAPAGGVGAGYPAYTFNQSIETNVVASLRPRVGVAFDRFLVYATGGLAVGNVDGNTQFFSSGGYSKAGSKSDTKFGYTVGGGIEYAVTNNWTVKGEYLYTDLGKVSYTTGFVLPAFPAYSETIRHNMKFHTVRAGVNYKF